MKNYRVQGSYLVQLNAAAYEQARILELARKAGGDVLHDCITFDSQEKADAFKCLLEKEMRDAAAKFNNQYSGK